MTDFRETIHVRPKTNCRGIVGNGYPPENVLPFMASILALVTAGLAAAKYIYFMYRAKCTAYRWDLVKVSSLLIELLAEPNCSLFQIAVATPLLAIDTHLYYPQRDTIFN